MRWCLSLLVVLISLGGRAACAHEVRPGYLEVRQKSAETYDVLFKVPALGEQYRLGLHLSLPGEARDVVPPQASFEGGAHIQRRTIELAGGLDGQRIGIDGLSAMLTDVLARVESSSGGVQIQRLSPENASFVVNTDPAAAAIAATYVRIGFEHILGGIDHLLFVLGLLLLVKGWKRVAVTITAFTVAHSLTLAAATFGVIRIAEAPLNAAIALSILFLGSEIVRSRRGETTLGSRYPWGIAFGFGLLHGCGFASGLATTGLPPSDIPFALLFFNIGVELGQLVFVALYYALLWAVRKIELPAPGWARMLPAYIVGTAGAYWTILQLRPFMQMLS